MNSDGVLHWQSTAALRAQLNGQWPFVMELSERLAEPLNMLERRSRLETQA